MYLYDYFEEFNVISVIVDYLIHDLVSQLIDNGVGVSKIDYI